MIHTYQAIISSSCDIRLLQDVKFKKPHRALLVVLDDSTEESIFEKSSSYILSENSLAEDWNRQEEDEAWAYLQ